MKKKFFVKGMYCSACKNHVEKDVSKVEGVKEVNVNLITNSMVVEYDENCVDENIIINAVKKGGYKASIYDVNKAIVKKSDIKLRFIKLIVSLMLMISLMYVAMGDMIGLLVPFNSNHIANAILQMALLVPICILNGIFFVDGYKKLSVLKPNMSSLIAVASSASIIYSVYEFVLIVIKHNQGTMIHPSLYFDSAGMVLTLVSLGKFIEFKSKNKTTSAINDLFALVPDKVIRINNNTQEEIFTEEIKLNDILFVKSGKTIPVDGIITNGECEIDESSITGESKLVYKKANDTVIASTIVINGAISIQATSTASDSTVAKIISIVEEASNSKAPISRIADKVSSIFVPVVFLISIITFILWELITKDFNMAFKNAITVLVISCPCALGLATPLSIMLATGISAKRGILFKNAESLENLHKIDKIYLDKTGTITSGKMKVEEVKVTSSLTKKEIIKIAASLESLVIHPLSASIVDANGDNGVYEVVDFNNDIGKGINGTINGIKYYLGSYQYIKEKVDTIKEENSINTILFLATDTLLGSISLSDAIKENTFKAIEYMRRENIKIGMISGDNEKVAKDIAYKLQLDEFYFGVLPIDKGKIIKESKSKGYITAMVGDGINDAVSLIEADEGIAIGAGADVAISSANIVLMKNDLTDVSIAIDISRETIKNIKVSLFFAFIYNILCIPIACGILYPIASITFNPMIAAIAMCLSSISVVTNALRLNRINKKIDYKYKQ